jgi:hypothetical protein
MTGNGTSGTPPAWDTISATDIPTLNQNTSGSAGSVAYALTIGTGLSGTSFNGSAAVTIAIDSTVALRADTHYIGTTSVALNRSSANLALTGISSVTFPGSVSGSAALQANSIAYQTYSGYFNVAAAGLVLAHNTALDLSSGNFTIECWVYKSTNSTAGEYILGKSGNASSNYNAYALQFGASNALNFSTANSNGASSQSTYSIGTLSLNTWYHVAVVKTGPTIITYLNGVQGTSTTQGAAIVDRGLELVIGNQYNNVRSALSTGASNGQLIDTYISNFRILKGTALYTSTPFTVPTAALANITNTSLLTLQNATIVDNSTANSGVGFTILDILLEIK